MIKQTKNVLQQLERITENEIPSCCININRARRCQASLEKIEWIVVIVTSRRDQQLIKGAVNDDYITDALGRGKGTIKNTPHGQCNGHLFDTPAKTVPLQRTPQDVARTTELTWIYSSLPLGNSGTLTPPSVEPSPRPLCWHQEKVSHAIHNILCSMHHPPYDFHMFSSLMKAKKHHTFRAKTSR